MARIKIELPDHFSFTTVIPVRITDLNYGGHVGNDAVLAILHEARVQFLRQFGYGELTLGGVGMIMRDVAIEFKSELFYGDFVKASVTVSEISNTSFEMYYKLEKEENGKTTPAAFAKSGMVCYDYSKKKVAPLPDEVRAKFTS